MRYLLSVAFVLAGLVGSPASVSAATAQKASQEPPSWLQMELHTPGLRMTYSELQQLALIPQHLQQRMPGDGKKHSDGEEAKSTAATEEGRSKGMSRGGKIAVGVIVPLVVVGVVAGAVVMATGFDDL